MKISTDILIEQLKGITPNGYQVSIPFGIINVTRAIYQHNNLFYVFDISEDFIFEKENGYMEEEFLNNYESYLWLIEMII